MPEFGESRSTLGLNEGLGIYEGPMMATVSGQEAEVQGNVRFDWLPFPRVTFELNPNTLEPNQLNNSIAVAPRDHLSRRSG